MSGRVYGYELLHQGGSWLGAARSWLQHKRTTKGVHGNMIMWGDPNARFELGADSVEELASEVAAAAFNEQNEEIAHLKRKLQSVESERDELRMAANAPDDFVIMSRRRWKEMLAAERAADKKTT